MQLYDSGIHRTFNAMVARSNRARPTTKPLILKEFNRLPVELKQYNKQLGANLGALLH